MHEGRAVQFFKPNSQTICTKDLIIVVKACASLATYFGRVEYRTGAECTIRSLNDNPQVLELKKMLKSFHVNDSVVKNNQRFSIGQ